ncbi:MAG: hypothetical protein FJW27_03475 [Acidimicrobiia bacterium]|nr:hypothetical protein [Acidimicrobiia bacterium]
MPHHEEGDIYFGAIFKFVIYLAIFVAIVQVFTFYVMRSIDNRMVANQEIRYPLLAEQGERLPPAPRLQTLPKEELAALREAWRRDLEGYSWVDKSAGTVRMPIELAMRRVLERGLPARAAESSPATPAPATLRPPDATKPAGAPAGR